MGNPKLIKQYREQMFFLHRVTITVVSAVEIIAYLIFVRMGMQSLSLKNTYLWLNVITPICINVLAHIIAMTVNRTSTASAERKNAFIIYAALVTTFVVSLFHRDYMVALCAFVFPIILSALYNDRKLLRRSFWLAVVSLSITVIILYVERKLDLTKTLNVIILYGFIVVSYMSGVLSIKFSERNFSLIEEQAIANSNLENIVELDRMTGLYNHSAFYDKLEIAIHKSKTENIECCLALIDIDDFKFINDTYGHDSGDVVIITIANILKEVCDGQDCPCRYGGEEFAIVFIGKDILQVKEKIYESLKQFSRYRFDFTEKSLTFSCGIAQFDGNETCNELFARADERLYISKKNGKNQITV